MTFWVDFWPNFLATLVGVLIGVPIALYINRHAMSQGEKVRRQAERQQTADALKVLQSALEQNRPRLKRLADVLAKGEAVLDTGIDVSTWEALQGSLSAKIRDADLSQRLAYHFSRLSAVARFNDMYVRFAVGVESSMSTAPVMKQKLRSTLSQAVADLLMETDELPESIDKERNRLSGGG